MKKTQLCTLFSQSPPTLISRHCHGIIRTGMRHQTLPVGRGECRSCPHQSYWRTGPWRQHCHCRHRNASASSLVAHGRPSSCFSGRCRQLGMVTTSRCYSCEGIMATLMFVPIASHTTTMMPHLLGWLSRPLGLLEQTPINLCVDGGQPWDVAREAWEEVREEVPSVGGSFTTSQT